MNSSLSTSQRTENGTSGTNCPVNNALSAGADLRPFGAVLRSTFLPDRVLVLAVEGDNLDGHAGLVPFVAGKLARRGKATAYVCRSGVCRLPTTDPQEFAKLLLDEPATP